MAGLLGDDFLTRLISEQLRIPESKPSNPLHIPPPTRDIKSPLTRKWNPVFVRRMNGYLSATQKMIRRRIKEITTGLTMPAPVNLPIGGAKQMEAAILFFDLQDFTTRSSQMENRQTLATLNTIIPVVMHVVRNWNGEIEKNTGDGIMAIFGTETRNSFVIARDAIEAAMSMRYLMWELINPHLQKLGIDPFYFRIGIDMENILVARIGIRNHNFLTVVSDAANRASKLQELAEMDGVCIGNNLYNNLHASLQKYCLSGKDNEWNWLYQDNPTTPYNFYHFRGYWPEPKKWLRTRLVDI